MNYLPRTSIDASQHGIIDIELKSFKIQSRRLQSTLATHATELRILHRLYYKNKNQHRGAIFWRKITEVRRYSERLESLNLLSSTMALRFSFYGSTTDANGGRGPWTHCPGKIYLATHAKHCQTALQLVDKMINVCLSAYRSFHRSMQSGAFLQVLLMAVAIASRMRTLSTELQDILKTIFTSTTRLRDTVAAHIEEKGMHKSPNDGPEFQHLRDPDENAVINATGQRSDVHPLGLITVTLATSESATKPLVETITREIKMSSTSSKVSEKLSHDTTLPPKKKKRKGPRNEIDDIFGF